MSTLVHAGSPVSAVASLYWLSQLRTITAKVTAILAQQAPGQAAGAAGPDESAAMADAVHDLRVAVRRCQSTARALAPYLQGEWPRKIDKALQPMRKACDRVRDLDVLLLWLQEQPAAHLATAGLLEALRRRHDQAYARLCEALESGGAVRTVARIDAGLQQGLLQGRPATPAAEATGLVYTVADVAAPALLATAAQLTARARAYSTATDPAARGQALHQLRIAGKDFRYTLELLMPALSPDAAVLRDWCCRFQDCLGEIHDTLRFAKLITRLERKADLPHEQVAGLLGELSLRQQDRLPRLAEMLQPMTPQWFAGTIAGMISEGG
jgi:CHAD domain-containing protein